MSEIIISSIQPHLLVAYLDTARKLGAAENSEIQSPYDSWVAIVPILWWRKLPLAPLALSRKQNHLPILKRNQFQFQVLVTLKRMVHQPNQSTILLSLVHQGFPMKRMAAQTSSSIGWLRMSTIVLASSLIMCKMPLQKGGVCEQQKHPRWFTTGRLQWLFLKTIRKSRLTMLRNQKGMQNLWKIIFGGMLFLLCACLRGNYSQISRLKQKYCEFNKLLGLVFESPVRSGYLPFLTLTETLTSHTKSQISN